MPLPRSSSTERARPRKRFGQHFLVQPGIAQRIVDLAALNDTKTVLEIGPGRGALTGLLATRAGKLILVEIDRDLCRELREKFAGDSRVAVVEGDVLALDLEAQFAAEAPLTVVANLPYNISTPVLMKLLASPDLFSRLVLMLQREVAERLCAAAGSNAYGGLSVMAQTAARAQIAFVVPATAFTPRPKVESAVVVIEPKREALGAARRRLLRHIVRTLFSRRRKQLVNGLAGLTANPTALLERLAIDPRRRPETLTVEDFERLAAALESETTAPPADEPEPHA
jgi:16S rRNA (adenine1518-N6/adenine1519-N6)-dimethyltransferase